MTRRGAQEIRHAQEPDIRLRADPDRLAGLVLLHRPRRRAGAGRARAVDRADPANPVHVPGGLSLQMAAAARQPSSRRRLSRHLRLFLHLFPFRVRTHRDLFARLLHAAGFHRRAADVPAGDGAVPARPSASCSGPTSSWSSTRSGAISARSISSGIPARRFYRVVTSSTVEFSTGIYGIYGQLALTLIAAFLLLAGVANGFDAQRAMINVVRLIAGRSRQLIPQTAVVGSSAIGMISGSGSANAAVVGTITIPLMMRYGVPGTFAAAVETSASMGGLIMPPMMGVGAFLMSEFLGVPYWDVVLRGFALAFVYYVSIGVAVYLLCVRLLPRDAIEKPQVPLYDKVKTAHLLLLRALSHLSDGLRRQGRIARRALYRDLHARPAGRGLPLFQIRAEGSRARGRNAVRQHPARDRNPCRDDVLSDAAARDARHHDRPVHRHRLHQPDGRDAARPRRLEHHRHDLHGLDFRLARRRRPAADRDLHHRRGRHRAADAGARHQPLGRAFLRVPAVGLGRAVAADLAHRRGLRAHRQRVVPARPCTRR